MNDEKMNTFPIKLSVGIGRNIAEAEYALKIAKKNKYKPQKFNIQIYSGKKLNCDKPVPKTIIDAYLRLEKKLSDSPKALLDLEKFKKDPKTKLLNKLGYYIEKTKLEQKKEYNPDQRFILLFDADSMHDLNKKYGFAKVDKYLEAIGKALNDNIRDSLERKEKDLLKIKDLLNNRKNDSAGDEFIIDLSCDKKHLRTIAERYLIKCYEYQKKIL